MVVGIYGECKKTCALLGDGPHLFFLGKRGLALDMQKTIFDNRVLIGLLRALARFWFWCAGWRIEGELPEEEKFVLIAAPHTSNWDFPFMMGVALGLRQSIFWMGKHTLFAGRKGPIVRWLGGIPVDRTSSQDLVGQTIAQFNGRDRFIIAIAPEGTRGSVRQWKTGFYHVAEGARVPIVTGFLDYRRRVGGVGPTFHASGDMKADMAEIWGFYASIEGKYPEKAAAGYQAP